ncbi:helix-turn-helix domain-containing protein [Corynebacterium belfantii]|uniref:helix-turn-helix domain-containing protein n=1 Tax=Corynebacterium belfantii TaxID=2014537 RepID=UPI0018EFA985|nr:helix-turn-helix domain-containing protein [Corynebacterium belfantii]
MTAKSIQKSYTADEAIGITVNQLMFTHRVTRKMLGDALGISGQTLGRKVRGQISWSLAEIFAIAAYFNIEVTDLLPRRVPQMQETPDSLSRTEGSNLVAGVGFEPTTSGL